MAVQARSPKICTAPCPKSAAITGTTKTKVRTERLFVLSPRVVSLDTLLPSQGAGLERSFDDMPFIKRVQRANEAAKTDRDAPRETRRKKEKPEANEEAP